MPPEPPPPVVVLAREVVADVEAQVAEQVVVQLRSPQFLVQLLLAAEVAAVEVPAVDVSVVVLVLPPNQQQIVALKCPAWRSSTCCWLPV